MQVCLCDALWVETIHPLPTQAPMPIATVIEELETDERGGEGRVGGGIECYGNAWADQSLTLLYNLGDISSAFEL